MKFELSAVLFFFTSVSMAQVTIPKASDYTDRFAPSAYPFNGTLAVEDIPQFITITIDDGLSPARIKPIQDYLLSIRDKRGCAPRFTHFTSFDYTLCPLVGGVYKAGMEMSTHTVAHNWYPNLEQIKGAYEGYARCGVPLEEVKGFRAPFLKFNTEILTNLKDVGVLYESSVEAGDAEVYYTDFSSNYGNETIWPFTWESFPQNEIYCNKEWDCSQANGLDGLWEIPMNFWYLPKTTSDAEEKPKRTVNIMDYSDFSEEMATQNFLRRYENNRAPFGIFVHADPWLVGNGQILKNWIEGMLDNPAYPDVHFVTNQELLAWMKNPVPKDQYQPRNCHDHGDVFDCFPPAPEYKCKWGEIWNSATCSCECNTPRCATSDGRCTDYCPDRVVPDTEPAADQCCPDKFTGYRAYNNCQEYYYCSAGELTTGAEACPAGMLFDEFLTTCNFPFAVSDCNVDSCTWTTAAPVAAPTASPIAAPTASPIATPTASPVATPTAAPVPGVVGTDAPVGSPPVGGGNGCCSQNFATCVDWCGTDQAGCDACNGSGGYYWLPNGSVEGTCLAKWSSCTDTPGSCCPGLECVGTIWYKSCSVVQGGRNLRG